MKKFFLAALCIPITIFGQIQDTFDDGNFNENPVWKGTDPKFIVNADLELQLHDTAAGTAYLSTGNYYDPEIEWRFWIKMAFSPSGNNQARFYLMSDREDLTQPLNGYFLQFGETGSLDAIELFRQEGENLFTVCRGKDGTIAGAFALDVKVTLEEGGRWRIFVDADGMGQFIPESEGYEDSQVDGPFMGMYCKYTVSNATRVYFDNIYAGPVIKDKDPPVLSHVRYMNDNMLSLTFNESLDSLSASNKYNYQVDNATGIPDSVYYGGNFSRRVVLFYDREFPEEVNLLLIVSNILDISGNVLLEQQMPFSTHRAIRYDVTINEIMADPSPAAGLPEFEFLELHNRTEFYIDLSDWSLTVGAAEDKFSEVTLQPHGYLIVCAEEALDAFKSFGSCYGLPDISLANAGQVITLIDDDQHVISEIQYDDNWYNDPDKNDGGWSLEQVNPANVCSGKANWSASNDSMGGTPGKVNSMFNDSLIHPAITGFELLADNIIRLWFNQDMDYFNVSVGAHYLLEPEFGAPDTVYVDFLKRNIADLYFQKSFTPGIIYGLTVLNSVRNCSGAGLAEDTVITFAIGQEPLFNDIVINEILFNPRGEGVDYVELFNRSGKVFDVRFLQLGLGRINPPNPVDTVFYDLCEGQVLLMPDEFLLLTSSSQSVRDQYFSANTDAFLEFLPFPAYPNEQGICLLKYNDELIVDAFHYHEDMHFPLLVFKDGVALERVNPDAATQDDRNWSSAAETVGFGTPGYANSQFLSGSSSGHSVVIEPEIFSPDNDGYHDIQAVTYSFDKAGYSLSIDIFNADGILVRKLANNEYVGTKGAIFWDGTQENRRHCPAGIYIYLIRVLDTGGKYSVIKRSGALAVRL